MVMPSASMQAMSLVAKELLGMSVKRWDPAGQALPTSTDVVGAAGTDDTLRIDPHDSRTTWPVIVAVAVPFSAPMRH